MSAAFVTLTTDAGSIFLNVADIVAVEPMTTTRTDVRVAAAATVYLRRNSHSFNVIESPDRVASLVKRALEATR